MLLERTIAQLDVGPLPPEKAEALGQLGYIQWLGSLKGGSDYHAAAHYAYAMAGPFQRGSPAVEVFCDLLMASTNMPPRALDVALPPPERRGGAQARRGAF